jgi:transcriptional regulator GlxA family with amidase domain
VVLLADRLRTVRARGGLRIQPEVEIGEYRELDILIVPGGIVTAELRREEVTDWIKEVSSRSKVTASVCTGAFLLAQAGLLEGRRATTHWEDIDNLARMFPGVDVERGVRWVDTGEVVTSAGISAGIDMSLHLVARFWGRELAEQTARQMEFDWVGKEVY